MSSEYGPHINADRGVGVKWLIEKDGKKYELRIDNAQPNSPFDSQRRTHVSITVDGNKVVDNTGKNYILYDSKNNYLYKIKRVDLDAGRSVEKYRFDIINNPSSRDTSKLNDAHIPGKDWLIKWKDIFYPE